MAYKTDIMDETTQKLIDCFLTVFPALAEADVLQASVETVAHWDSLAHVTLLSLVREEFGVDFDFEDFAGAVSFTAMRETLGRRLAA